MRKVYKKHILRTVTGSAGRYLAIFAIVALGVGFFSGLCTTKKSMLETANRYFIEQSLYHFRAVSTVGFDTEAVNEVAKTTGTKVYGGISADMLTEHGKQETVLHCLSLTDGVNTPTLLYGKMPKTDGEVLADWRLFGKDDIGETLEVNAKTAENFSLGEYKITGIARSPLYINLDRGTTSLADGKTDGFLLMRENAFQSDIYTELYIDAGIDDFIYSDEYESSESTFLPKLETVVNSAADGTLKRLASVVPSPDTTNAANFPPVQTYVFTRGDSAAYSSFESDSTIVEGIAKVFPLFFMAVAALVCSTTMTRMLDEQRSETGTLFALGFGKGAILFKYIFYAGSSALLGCAAGYFGGSWLFPFVIWKAYGLIYGFAPLKYTLSPIMAAVSLCGAMLCSAGITWIVCRRQLSELPAQLIRPRAPAAGKRILAERVRFFWNKLSFLHKVTARNVFRYKKRMIMMLIGIGGCTALVLTGFGIKDSIADIVDYQFSDIMKYDLAVSYSGQISVNETAALERSGAENYTLLRQETADIKAKRAKTATLLIAEADLGGLVDLHDSGGKPIPYPKKGEAVINANLAKLCGAAIGDIVTLQNGNRSAKVKISGLCENYVYNYIYISSPTYEEYSGEYNPNSAFISLKESTDPHKAATGLQTLETVAGVAVTEDIRTRVSNSMKSLNAVVWVVILSAGTLALIVLFNLSNINVTERVREIATVKVLGFRSKETASYVFRESRVLTLMGTLTGLPFGVLLHRFVMSQIQIDMVSFRAMVLPQSYLFTFLTVVAFELLTELLMLHGVNDIPMAESLKSTE